jgi:hypothetical protein
VVISYTVAKLLTDSAWEKSYSMRVGAGGATEPTTPAFSTTAARRECRRADGDFRALVVGAIMGRRGHGVETFPTNLPVLEAAVEVLKLMGEQATSHPSSWAPFVLVGDGGAP